MQYYGSLNYARSFIVWSKDSPTYVVYIVEYQHVVINKVKDNILTIIHNLTDYISLPQINSSSVQLKTVWIADALGYYNLIK